MIFAPDTGECWRATPSASSQAGSTSWCSEARLHPSRLGRLPRPAPAQKKESSDERTTPRAPRSSARSPDVRGHRRDRPRRAGVGSQTAGRARPLDRGPGRGVTARSSTPICFPTGSRTPSARPMPSSPPGSGTSPKWSPAARQPSSRRTSSAAARCRTPRQPRPRAPHGPTRVSTSRTDVSRAWMTLSCPLGG